jgi:hypothetical protein
MLKRVISYSRTFSSSSIPIKQSVKRLISFSNFRYEDLRKIGYPESESEWIVEMRDAYFDQKNDLSKIFSNDSMMYTSTITNVIEKNDWKTWEKNFIHIPFSDMFTQFYLKGFSYIGNGLVSYNFHSNKFIRDEFMEHRKTCLTSEEIDKAYFKFGETLRKYKIIDVICHNAFKKL